MDDDILDLLDLTALEEVRKARRRIVELAGVLLSKEPTKSLQRTWEYDQAVNELNAVEAEIEKRAAVI